MNRRAQTGLALGGLAVFVVLLSGCPLKFEKEARDNVAPITFFDVTPPDTTFRNEVFFRWIGTDLDSDVVAYQYQFVTTDSVYYESAGQLGEVTWSIDPWGDPDSLQTAGNEWTARRTDNFESFSDMADGWYEMRARSIDSEGAPSAPAVFRFKVFFDDIAPVVMIRTRDCGRTNNSSGQWGTGINATDESRSSVTPRSALTYSYSLQARAGGTNCGYTSATPTSFEPFPASQPDTVWVEVPETQEFNGIMNGCVYDFRVSVRDVAGNEGQGSCCMTPDGSCS